MTSVFAVYLEAWKPERKVIHRPQFTNMDAGQLAKAWRRPCKRRVEEIGQNTKCYDCNLKGHLVRECQDHRRYLSSSSAVSNKRKPLGREHDGGSSVYRLFSVGLARSPMYTFRRNYSSKITVGIVIDSAASQLVITDPELLTDVQQVPDVNIKLSYKRIVTSSGGRQFTIDVGKERIMFSYVHLIPGTKPYINSCSRLDGCRVSVTIGGWRCILTDSKTMSHSQT